MKNKQNSVLDILLQSSTATVIYTSTALDIGFINRGMRTILAQPKDTEISKFTDLAALVDADSLANLLVEIWNSKKPMVLATYPIKVTSRNHVLVKYVDWEVQPILHPDGTTQAMIHTLKEVINPFDGITTAPTSTVDTKLAQWSHTLSHDLRNPLSVAKLGMQYMHSRKELSTEDREKWVRVVLDALQNVEKLITDKLANSRTEASKETKDALAIATLMPLILQNAWPDQSAKPRFEIGTLVELDLDKHLLYHIFSLAIHLVAQSLQDISSATILLDSLTSDRSITYFVGSDSIVTDHQLVGVEVLKKLMCDVDGKLLINHSGKNNFIELNFNI